MGGLKEREAELGSAESLCSSVGQRMVRMAVCHGRPAALSTLTPRPKTALLGLGLGLGSVVRVRVRVRVSLTL